MKKKQIKDETFGTNITLFYDCTEKEFAKHYKKSFDYEIEVTDCSGETVEYIDKEIEVVWIWIKKNKDVETLSHEIIHAIKYWLLIHFDIPFNSSTEEVYATLHSFYMGEFLRELKLEKLTDK